ncbi:MAG: MaoC/PaaZ C-terminal domain-containing protein [Jatrophihabitans sp.]|uniref:MaoC/PaaZ C-terminal domain-containing protein n=1 Tax=Jatrophihabitans sp. TaxID=1932789 RepID=UPI003F806F0E
MTVASSTTSVREFTSSPSLGPLFAKAALMGPLHRGGSLPTDVYRLADVTIDADHLAAYQQVCGFRVTDVLPPTYLHILAFPLSVELMTQRAFPFPLIGSVHVNNTIEVRRPVLAGETPSFEVRVADLRPHPAGQQFDVLADVTIAGEPVWSSRSTYLRRGASSGEKSPRPAAVPEPTGVTRLRVPSDIGRRYGAVSGDRNPIHLTGLTARAFGFSSAIAHGMWLKARTLATLEGRLPDAYDVDVAFKTPVFLPSTIAVSTPSRGSGFELDVRNARNGKPHLAGTITPR